MGYKLTVGPRFFFFFLPLIFVGYDFPDRLILSGEMCTIYVTVVLQTKYSIFK